MPSQTGWQNWRGRLTRTSALSSTLRDSRRVWRISSFLRTILPACACRIQSRLPRARAASAVTSMVISAKSGHVPPLFTSLAPVSAPSHPPPSFAPTTPSSLSPPLFSARPRQIRKGRLPRDHLRRGTIRRRGVYERHQGDAVIGCVRFVEPVLCEGEVRASVISVCSEEVSRIAEVLPELMRKRSHRHEPRYRSVF
ncbi:hypothetical protein HD554DRAFT_542936 [Boletus coccyginus]|nr:hypothetical protein HD554DRAFT_542936 [Boletus coccyginus]